MASPWTRLATSGLFFVIAAIPAHAAWDTQTLTLNPGWNAVFLEVQPSPNTCEAVFEDVPVESVWAWNESFSSAQYVRDPSQLVPDDPDWLTYFPSDDRRHFLTNLYRVYGGKAYLIELGGTSPVTLELHGELEIRPVEWLSDSFNLVGFHVDAEKAPTFESFFEASKAHREQPMYRLNSAGEWNEIQDKSGARMKRGESYWVYTEGRSAYQGPLGVEVQFGKGIEFGKVMSEHMLRIRNSSPEAKTVTLTPMPSRRPISRTAEEGNAKNQPPLAGEVALAYKRLLTWQPMTKSHTVTVDPESVLGFPLAVLRGKMNEPSSPSDVFESILEVTDEDGSRFLIPVTAQKTMHDTGLWVGTVQVQRVSETGASTNTPTPTASDFRFRLIVHVDGEDPPTARLLQEAFLMQVQEQTDDDGNVIEEQRYVVLTDDSLVPQFEPITMRDGELAGRRISSPVFALPQVDDGDGNLIRAPIAFTGQFEDSLTGTITLPFDDPLNPFVHAFHPDHNNLNELYDEDLPLPEGEESFTISRRITLEFQDESELGLSNPNWGHDLVGGVYKERIRGVHKRDIFVEGTFRLNRVVEVPVLNDGQ